MRLVLPILIAFANLFLASPCPAAAPDGRWSILPALPTPSSTAKPELMYDAVRNQMLLFGGETFGMPRAVIWARPTNGSSRWVPLPSIGEPSTIGRAPTAILDTARDRIVIWDGQNRMLWSVTLGPILQWTGRAIPDGPDLISSADAFDAVHRRMLMWSGNRQYEPMTSDVWALALDDDAARWTTLPTLGPAPTPRDGAVAVVDVANDRLIVHGGRDFTHSGSHLVRGDVWALPLSGAMQWTPLFTADDSIDVLYSGHSAVVDTLRRRMLLFGGATGDHVNSTHAEVKAFALDGSNVWSVAVPPDAERLGVGGGIATAYDAAADAVSEYQPIRTPGSYSTRRLALSPTPEWSVVEPNPLQPPRRFGQATAFDPVRSRWLSFGGRYSYTSGEIYTLHYDDLWSLSLLDRPEWEMVTAEGSAPPGRLDGQMLYDPIGDRMVLFGGQVTTGVSRPFPNRPGHGTPHFHGDTWILTLAGSPSWLPAALTGPSPGPRDGHVMVLDPKRNRVLVFGGRDSLSFKNDLWSLSLDEPPQWTLLNPGGALPSPRWQAVGCFDATLDRLVIAGGRDATGSVGDAFEMSLAGTTIEWAPLTTTGTWPTIGAGARSSVFDASRNRILIFGDGNANELSGPASPLPAWKLELGRPASWSPLASQGHWPEQAYGIGAALDPAGDRVLLGGGTIGPRGTASRNQQWILNLSDVVTVAGFSLVSSREIAGRIELIWSRVPGATSPWRVDRREGAGAWRDRGPATADGEDRLRFVDSEATPGGRYAYRLHSNSNGGELVSAEWWVSVPVVSSLTLESPRPNPARHGAIVSFGLSRPGSAVIDVFDLVGRRRETRSFLDAGPGTYSTTVGASLEPGVYLVRLSQTNQTRVRRLLVLR